jgi:AraC-like DNA-binding protein
MEPVNLKQHFLYSCSYEKKRSEELFVPEHAFGIILAGESHFYPDGELRVVPEGTIGLIRRNQLLKSFKVPPPGGEFRSINIVLNREFLRRYAAERGIRSTIYRGEGMLEIRPTRFITGYFDSLMPYFDDPDRMTEAMAALKMREALELLLESDPRCSEFLFDFSEPFKIDLEAFMNTHFTYNVPMAQFAKLTGRSLATFKRDFQKIFASPPERWLKQKRLEHAHFLIAKREQSPGAASIDAGFENLSHFSNAFKQFFGYTPSSLQRLSVQR